MRLFSTILVSSLAMFSAFSAAEMIDGSDPEAILTLAKGHGRAELSKDEQGDPSIQGRMNGHKYRITFYDCEENKNCKTLSFDAAWETKSGIEVERVNEWNQNKRFGRAFVDQDGDAALDWDVNLTYGVESENFDDTLRIWGDIMQEYADFINE